MSDPQSLFVVIPATLAVGEPFAVKVKVLGAVRRLESRGQFCTPKPSLHGPFNLNVERQIQYVDNALPAWTGRLRVASEGALRGPAEIVFDGKRQGVFPGDTRPIATFGEFAWTEPGIHFLRLEDPDSGVEAWSNPARVTAATPARRLVWGDPHWQTFFSDGIRCPEELYAFARDEGFLDFGAISDQRARPFRDASRSGMDPPRPALRGAGPSQHLLPIRRRAADPQHRSRLQHPR